jgi:uncharacterized protein (TIGR01777 family)
MRIFITGATGFIGRALVLRLRRDGHQPVAWVRNLERARSLLGQECEIVDGSGSAAAQKLAMAAAVGRCDAVVNLAGENIAKGRWTVARKQALVRSRVDLTQALVESMRGLDKRPSVFVSASAVGLYGDCGAAPVDEAAPADSSFLASLCRDWEAAAGGAEALGVRVVLPRIGIVLGHEGGILSTLLPLFMLGLGGPLGDGKQYLPWVHLHDLVETFVVALTDSRYTGAYNAVSPNPVDNAAFTQALARACKKTAPLRVPSWAMRAAMGEAATFALSSCRAVPSRLQAWGFPFKFAHLEQALQSLLDFSLLTISPLRPDHPPPLPDAYTQVRRPVYLLRSSTDLRHSRADVFEFFCRAQNLGLMTPMQMAMQIVGEVPRDVQAGTCINYTLKVGPVPLRWRTRIARWQPPQLFTDAQERGPYRCWWHEHHFSEVGSGTRMEDRVYYAAPLGLLGRLAHFFMIKRQLHQIFWYRQSAITLRFG